MIKVFAQFTICFNLYAAEGAKIGILCNEFSGVATNVDPLDDGALIDDEMPEYMIYLENQDGIIEGRYLPISKIDNKHSCYSLMSLPDFVRTVDER